MDAIRFMEAAFTATLAGLAGAIAIAAGSGLLALAAAAGCWVTYRIATE